MKLKELYIKRRVAILYSLSIRYQLVLITILSFQVCNLFQYDIGEIIKLYEKWTTIFPNIKPYYAVKCNPNPVLLDVLACLGTYFDCASENELKSVIELTKDPNRIIFANGISPRNEEKITLHFYLIHFIQTRLPFIYPIVALKAIIFAPNFYSTATGIVVDAEKCLDTGLSSASKL